MIVQRKPGEEVKELLMGRGLRERERILSSCDKKVLRGEIIDMSSWLLLTSSASVGWSITSWIPPWVTASRFLARNIQTKVKPNTFSLLLFSVFLFIFLLPPTPTEI